ncbi:hypothetical protein CRE_26696 [Caenorhabditis remanei]|uniref:F-box domain-containing protein n=1 Tax=Caenorhabditis remanei TaxID=31234 RepID=E3ML14_CAERE|nr:hypothetical protein CRE_26696 [Caenorhabditis remanei]
MNQLTSPKILRSCILFEFFRGKPVFETYKSFCEVMGYETITLKEFEIWYHRFSRGEFDLEHNIGPNTSALEFSNLPTDAIGKIIEKCDLKELTLRKVSKNLRSLVDEQKIAYKSIEIYLEDSFIFCAHNDKKVVYASENLDEKKGYGYIFKRSFIIRSEDYVKIALNDLSIALKNPKLRLEFFDLKIFSDSNDIMNRLESLLKHQNHKQYVKRVSVYSESPECLLSGLPCLRPKVLEGISIYGSGEDSDVWASKESERVREIANLEQWKQAEELFLFPFNHFPLEFLMHFKRFLIFDDVGKDFLMVLKNLFSTSTEFKSCTVELFGLESCSEYLESFCEKVDTKDTSVLLYRFKIPDESNKVLEFKLDKDEIIIKKKNF